MGVQKDAGELLFFFYDELINKRKRYVETKDVIDVTKWESNRINLAFQYLKDSNIIESRETTGVTNGVINFRISKLTPNGINSIENKDKFKNTFGFEINLGVIKFSWSRTKK